MPAVALSIAGSDPSGGAGLQADLQTFAMHGVHGAAVPTTLTVQNTVGVRRRLDLPADFVAAELDAVLDDLPVAAVKTGLLPTAAVVETVARRLQDGPQRILVVDPVLVATSGDALTDGSAREAIARTLLPLATLITPNMAEAAALAGCPVRSVADMHEAARRLLAAGAQAVLVTGGDLPHAAIDVLHLAGETRELCAARTDAGRVHGTGCTLSAAITARLAGGAGIADAVAAAKAYVTRAIAEATALGHGSLVLTHHPAPLGGLRG
jgi:hydroxymethylpyrimidine/phosphomethylpyrimidine kinase